MIALHALIERVRLAYRHDPWLAEVMSGFAILGWGLLAVRGFKQNPDWPTMDLMLRVIYGPVWGYLGAFFGICQIILCRLIDIDWRRPWLRFLASLIISWMWGAISISATGVEPWAPWISPCVVLCLGNAALSLRIFWTRR